MVELESSRRCRVWFHALECRNPVCCPSGSILPCVPSSSRLKTRTKKRKRLDWSDVGMIAAQNMGAVHLTTSAGLLFGNHPREGLKLIRTTAAVSVCSEKTA